MGLVHHRQHQFPWIQANWLQYTCVSSYSSLQQIIIIRRAVVHGRKKRMHTFRHQGECPTTKKKHNVMNINQHDYQFQYVCWCTCWKEHSSNNTSKTKALYSLKFDGLLPVIFAWAGESAVFSTHHWLTTCHILGEGVTHNGTRNNTSTNGCRARGRNDTWHRSTC